MYGIAERNNSTHVYAKIYFFIIIKYSYSYLVDGSKLWRKFSLVWMNVIFFFLFFFCLMRGNYEYDKICEDLMLVLWMYYELRFDGLEDELELCYFDSSTYY